MLGWKVFDSMNQLLDEMPYGDNSAQSSANDICPASNDMETDSAKNDDLQVD